MQKDCSDSFYLEFFHIEPAVIESQDIAGIIAKLKTPNEDGVTLMEQLGFAEIVPWTEAKKFKAHNRIDF